jgi:HK97 family phage major capsid protein
MSIDRRDHRASRGARLPGFKETVMPQTPDQARTGYAARRDPAQQHRETTDRLTETPASQALRLIAAQGKIGFQALSAVAENVEIQERALGLRVTEKRTYQRGGGSSYFQDLMTRQTGYGNPAEARARLDRHTAEVREDAPVATARMEARAAAEYERHIAGTREGYQALARMQRLGIRPFETRAIDRGSASAGEFTPPQWLLEDWVQAPRAGRAFADLWPTLSVPMNAGMSVNVPRWSAGLSAAPQSADGAAIASASPADTFSTCPLRTIAGYADVSAQWAEQGVRISDDVIFAELMADLGASLDAMLLLGSGTAGQLTGVIKAGAISSSNMAVVTSTNTDSNQTWVKSGSTGTPLWTAASALPGLMAKGRGKRPTHLVISPQTWDQVTGTLDGNARPLLPPKAVAPEPDDLVEMLGYPTLVHEGLPNSFGGSSTAPSVSTTGGGVTAYVDGTGTNVYSVLLGVRAPDLLLFQSAPRTEIFRDVLSGTLQWRFRISAYVASFADRYTAGSSVSTALNADVTGAISTGASTITGVVKAFETTSPMASAY